MSKNVKALLCGAIATLGTASIAAAASLSGNAQLAGESDHSSIVIELSDTLTVPTLGFWGALLLVSAIGYFLMKDRSAKGRWASAGVAVLAAAGFAYAAVVASTNPAANGDWSINGVAPGTYSLSYSAPGFETVVVEPLIVSDQNLVLDAVVLAADGPSGIDAIVINEILADVTSGADWDGINGSSTSGDEWIELYNPTSSVVDLNGCYLNDDDSGITNGYRFGPGETIPANGYLVIFGSDEDVDGDGFGALGNDGDTVIFAGPDQTPIDTVTYANNEADDDISYRRFPDGADTFEISSVCSFGDSSNGCPSPGSANLGAFTPTPTNTAAPTATETPTDTPTPTNTPVPANVRIVFVNADTDTITLENFGGTMADVSAYQLCAGFSYDAVGNQTVDSGSLMLAPNAQVTVSGFSVNAAGSDLAIYTDSNFSDPNSMLDFTQWGSGGNGRESVAVAKGIWTAGDFLALGDAYEYTGDGSQNGVSFWSTIVGPTPTPTITPTATNTPTITPTPTATATPDYSALVINEILGDPASSSDWDGDSTFDSGDDEWTEIHNTSSTPINLAGCTLGEFTNPFPAGYEFGNVTIPGNGYVVVYGSDVGVNGDVVGFINNGGDDLTLYDPAGNVIDTVSAPGFSDDTSYRRVPDGGAFELSAECSPGNSAAGCPSPGSANLALPPTPTPTITPTPTVTPTGAPSVSTDVSPIIVSEMMNDVGSEDWAGNGGGASEGVDEWMEIHNPTGTAIDISGCWLGDDDSAFNATSNVQMAPGTIIPAGGYLVFYGTDSAGGNISLGNSGDNIRFYDASGNLIFETPTLDASADRSAFWNGGLPATNASNWEDTDNVGTIADIGSVGYPSPGQANPGN